MSAAPLPDLTGRSARCTMCGTPAPSDRERLAFFEYRGPGSKSAEDTCKCGYSACAHADIAVINPYSGRPNEVRCGHFTPRGDGPDGYFCGCTGWD